MAFIPHHVDHLEVFVRDLDASVLCMARFSG